MATRDLYAGLMSGTSLDGVDAVLADFSGGTFRVLSHAHAGFDAGLRESLLALTVPGFDEIDRAGNIGGLLARMYAHAIDLVLMRAGLTASEVRAVGCHGQTIRHRPEHGFTLQIGNPALLAELAGIAVVADFRSRDMAAGGQGAPLVPAFHAVAFGDPAEDRAVVNIGGIANVTLLPRAGPVLGFDTGPGNCLMDLWAQRHLRQAFDAGGAWASGGRPIAPLLARLLEDPFFTLPAPKSSGRERFNAGWFERHLDPSWDPQAVQATLLELTAETIGRAIEAARPPAMRLIVCGGGARNDALMRRLRKRLAPVAVDASAAHGLAEDQVEATAFAWLARCAIEGKAGNLPEVTGAGGRRILGAIYPA
ncbi:MAG: anhydro-N-acetylmuramic acid kinase [Proteobacteria bacterium]|nr:anhydro-N-acetylmuramic acid kinase [Pseudomonadota bacterium]